MYSLSEQLIKLPESVFSELKTVHSKIPERYRCPIRVRSTSISTLIVRMLSNQKTNADFVAKIRAKIFDSQSAGFVRIDLNMLPDEIYQDISTLLCFGIGTPILPYANNEPFWYPLSVNLDARPNRTHGVGENPFHIDYIARQYPPDVIAFLGHRSDPLGGGYTELAPLKEAALSLLEEEYDILSQPFFHYWKDENTYSLGRHLNVFSVIPQNTDTGFIRFSTKMLPHLDGSDTIILREKTGCTNLIKKGLEKMKNNLDLNKKVFLVDRKHLVFFNQRRLAHSRTKLGEAQGIVPIHERRLMLQGYMRMRT